MSTIVAVDFGASRIKGVIWDASTNTITAECEIASPTCSPDALGRREISIDSYWSSLESLFRQLSFMSPNTNLDTMLLCTEMHGFMLADENYKPITGYVSWQDERAARDGTFESVSTSLRQCFKLMTGMNLRNGLPWLTLRSLSKSGFFRRIRRVKFFGLAEALVLRGGGREFVSHISAAAGSGLFNVNDSKWDEYLISESIGDAVLDLPEVSSKFCCIGRIAIIGRSVKVIGGIGDMTAAMEGAGINEEGVAVVNLGTGSQVATIGSSAQKSENYEIRFTSSGQIICAITHIPAGRALSNLACLLDSCAKIGGGTDWFWREWARLDAEVVLNSSVFVDLNLFPAAWKYSSSSGHIKLSESMTNATELISGVAFCWIQQYKLALDDLLQTNEIKSIHLAGGLSRRSPFVNEVLEKCTQLPTLLSKNNCQEESISGLLKSYSET
jgi:sugar (pentulose or hexulose) kinase